MRNPLISTTKIFVIYIISWGMLMFLQVFFVYYFSGYSFWVAVMDTLISDLTLAAVVTAIWYPVRYIRTGKALRLFLNQIFTALLVVSIWVISASILLKIILPAGAASYVSGTLSVRFFSGLLVYLISALCYYLYIYYSSLQEKRLKETRLSAMLKDTQIQLLKYQINPHFIFNSLNSVSYLTISDPEKAQEMVLKLSSFLRYCIQERSGGMVTLASEIDSIQNYLEIEQIRFQEKLKFTFEIDKACSKCMVPDLILQPLVENVIKHGVYESTGIVELKIAAHLADSDCIIELFNTTEPDIVYRKGTGLGLKNVRERIAAIYGRDGNLTIERSSEFFRVTIKIPFNEKITDNTDR